MHNRRAQDGQGSKTRPPNAERTQLFCSASGNVGRLIREKGYFRVERRSIAAAVRWDRSGNDPGATRRPGGRALCNEAPHGRHAPRRREGRLERGLCRRSWPPPAAAAAAATGRRLRIRMQGWARPALGARRFNRSRRASRCHCTAVRLLLQAMPASMLLLLLLLLLPGAERLLGKLRS